MNAEIRGRRPRSAAGFTLLELLAAAAIGAVLLGFIIVVLTNVSGFWARSSGRLSTAAQARYALDQLTLDLQSALFRDDGRVWLAADVPDERNHSAVWDDSLGAAKPPSALGTSLRYDAAELTETMHGATGVWLRFFATSRGTSRGGERLSAPVAVGWRIVRRAAGPSASQGEARYYLHRAALDPAETWRTGYDLEAESYTAAGTPVRSPGCDTIVAENVIDFGVRFYGHDASGTLIRIFPHANERAYRASRPSGAGEATERFPEVVDVLVRVLTEEGARRIAGFEAQPPRTVRPPGYGSDADYWWSLALAHSEVYTTRIVLPGAPR